MSDKILGGGFIVARQIFENELLLQKPGDWFKIWIYLISEVNHQDNKWFKRGSGYFNCKRIMDILHVTKSQIDHFIRWAKESQMLATRKATRGFIITIINYDKYQTLDNYYYEQSDREATEKRQRSDTIYKNVKNVKNEEEEERKTLFLDFVYLTEKEHKSLICTFGTTKTNDLIETLNNGIGAKGYKYKSHYHAILAWKRKEDKQEAIKPQNKPPDWIKNEKDSIDRANQERKADSHLPKELSTILTGLAKDKDIYNIHKEKSTAKCVDCKRPLHKVSGIIRQNKENGDLICEFCYNLK